ncbi:uncharacterized protein LOC120735497 isoform X4 [Simochromis diagramma]|nr:uncharacterized protein LOC120719253 isoform X4 [Simochromis diagramma]XP_039890834.1 uncharacterized protein LOC120735497 isoform X4 [Simochromis diagramma]
MEQHLSSFFRVVHHAKAAFSTTQCIAISVIGLITYNLYGYELSSRIEVKRECILKAVIIYLNENPENLIKEYMAFNVMEAEELERMDLGVYKIIHEGAQPDDSLEDVGIIIERCTVLQDLHDVASGCALLFGLIYCLNLSYPKPRRYTFEFFQKVLMGLEDKKLSNKIQVLKNKLCQKETQ